MNYSYLTEGVLGGGRRVKQLSGTLANCNTILEKKQKLESLILKNDHNKKGKE